ncbi:MAG TPA: glycosyltransferase [Thermoanaerobaculia bacterium]|nr:glycosyltransferase [Thermoanaerobaculia bacterium]
MSSPFISVVIPVRDRAATLERAIESVLTQTVPPGEVIVVDDGSEDGSAAVAEGFGPPVRVLRQPPTGVYAARNRGIEASRGELIAFLDSDDVWLPMRLECELPLLEDPSVGLVFGNGRVVDRRKGKRRRLPPSLFLITPPRRGDLARHLVWGNCIPTGSVLVRRECFERTGPFRTTARLSADYAKWMEIALNYRIDFVEGPVFEYVIHENNISADVETSLEARLGLFEAMARERTGAGERELLEHLCFNLRIHRVISAVRRRSVRLVGSRLAELARSAPHCGVAFWWSVQWIFNQARIRILRRLSGGKAEPSPAGSIMGETR